MSRKLIIKYPTYGQSASVHGTDIKVRVSDDGDTYGLHLTINGYPFTEKRMTGDPTKSNNMAEQTREVAHIVPEGGAIEIELDGDGNVSIYQRTAPAK